VRPDLSVDEAVPLLVVAWEMSPEEDRFAAFHSDTHGGEILGCGHLAMAACGRYSELYGVTGEVVKSVTNNLLSLNNVHSQTYGIPMARPILLGRHRESRVLIVESDDYTVDGQDSFRYDHLRHDQRLARLAQYATVKAADGLLRSVPLNTTFNAQELQEAASQQRNTTLGLLAVGLPIYVINMTTSTPNVTFISYVEPIAA
jgi:hypothetical protein